MPCPQTRPSQRHLRQGIAILFFFAGIFAIAFSRRRDSDDGRSTMVSLGLLFGVLGTLLHPGTRGDDQVPAASQRSLAYGMVRDNFGSTLNVSWTFARVLSQTFMALLAASYLGKSPATAFFANGGGLITLLYDRAWVDVRNFRARRLGSGCESVAAWGLNNVFGNILDTTAAFQNMGIAYLIDPEANGIDAEAIWYSLLPLYFGTVTGQAWSLFISRYPTVSKRIAARMPGHFLRLGVRHGTRVWRKHGKLDHPVLRFLLDLVSAFTLHRWTEARPLAVWSGLHVAPEIEAAQFATSPDKMPRHKPKPKPSFNDSFSPGRSPSPSRDLPDDDELEHASLTVIHQATEMLLADLRSHKRGLPPRAPSPTNVTPAAWRSWARTALQERRHSWPQDGDGNIDVKHTPVAQRYRSPDSKVPGSRHWAPPGGPAPYAAPLPLPPGTEDRRDDEDTIFFRDLQGAMALADQLDQRLREKIAQGQRLLQLRQLQLAGDIEDRRRQERLKGNIRQSYYLQMRYPEIAATMQAEAARAAPAAPLPAHRSLPASARATPSRGPTPEPDSPKPPSRPPSPGS